LEFTVVCGIMKKHSGFFQVCGEPGLRSTCPVNLVVCAKGQAFAEKKEGREQHPGLGTIPRSITSRLLHSSSRYFKAI
jgi:hypothetical protein